jgi:hypothetical protein
LNRNRSAMRISLSKLYLMIKPNANIFLITTKFLDFLLILLIYKVSIQVPNICLAFLKILIFQIHHISLILIALLPLENHSFHPINLS